jgi:hypothetical protein
LPLQQKQNHNKHTPSNEIFRTGLFRKKSSEIPRCAKYSKVKKDTSTSTKHTTEKRNKSPQKNKKQTSIPERKICARNDDDQGNNIGLLIFLYDVQSLSQFNE